MFVKYKELNSVFMQACEAQVTSKKATLTRLETTVVADAQTEDTRCLASFLFCILNLLFFRSH
jgi:hypothetical protein